MSKIKFSLRSEIVDAKLNMVYISDGINSISWWVSPLFNSLYDFKDMIIDIKSGRKESQIIFYGEPYEMHFKITIYANRIDYIVKYFGHRDPNKIIDYEIWLEESTSIKRMLHQLNEVLYGTHK